MPDKVYPKAMASALNKGARVTRTKSKDEIAARTGLPKGPVGKRLKMKRADGRKPTGQQSSRVSVFTRKFSASYRKKGSFQPLGKQTRAGVRVGRHMFTGAWVGKSSRYGRPYVGKRTGKSRDSVMYPHIDMRADKITKRKADTIGMKTIEKEIGEQIEKRTRKYLERI